jgi:branched-chain amino acid transport system permease protein
MTLLANLSALTGLPFWINVGLLAAIFGIFTLGLQLNVGFTGLYNFAQAGFMAVGAYAMAILTTSAHWSFWLSLPVSALVAVGFGLVVGIPTLRLRGDYFAIATIAFSETIRYAIQNATSLTGGTQGLLGYDTAWHTASGRMMSALGLAPTYFLVPLLLVGWVLLLIGLVLLAGLQRTPWGRVLRAIRDDEDAARALGKRVVVYKLQSLAVAAVLASVAGWILALDLSFLSPDEFLPDNTFIAFTMLLIGGLGSYVGVVVGAVVMETLLEGTRTIGFSLSDTQLASLRFMIVGALLILIVVVRPQGLFGKRSEMLIRR